MPLVEEIENIIDQRVDQRMKIFVNKQESMRTWVKMNVAMDRLGKDSRWIRGNLCILELIEKQLVKKAGGNGIFESRIFYLCVRYLVGNL